MNDLNQRENITGSRFLATSNHGFAMQGHEEIRRLFSPVRIDTVVPAELFRFDTSEDKEAALDKLRDQEPVFVRHLQPVDLIVTIDRTEADLARLQEAVADRLPVPEGAKVAVQTRKLDGIEYAYTPYSCKSAIDEVLVSRYHVEPVVQDAAWIVSVFLTADEAWVGFSQPSSNLSDWSGGAIRYRKEDGQVSRAKFKLLEAEQRFALDFRAYRHALDIGAAPGGWTSLLLERGCSVTAVDPAKLDPTLLRHPKLTYLAKNAGDIKLAAGSFDLLVCDMSWSPRQMTKLIRGLLPALQAGGTAIITVKLMHKKAFQTMREVVGDLSPDLQLQQAKQLFHNREELTMFFLKT